MKKILDINIGDCFGDFKCIDIIHKKEKSGYTNTYYKMKCKICGRTKEMLSSTIRLKHGIMHKSCGKGLKTIDKIFYSRWEAMRTRTINPNYEHSNCYQQRGINSDEFKYFIDFYDAMYDSFIVCANKIGKENTSLERIDVNKNYTKQNCIWIDKHDQPKNTRRTIKFIAIFPDGHEEIHTNPHDFAKKYNLDYETIIDVMNPNRSTKQHKHYKFKRIA